MCCIDLKPYIVTEGDSIPSRDTGGANLDTKVSTVINKLRLWKP